MGALEIVRTVINPAVDRPVVAVVEVGSRQRIVSHERIALGEALLKLRLQRLVVIVRIIAEIAETLRPAELRVEELPLVGAYRAEARLSGLVKVIVRSETCEDVGAFVRHVGDFERH